MTLGNVGKQSPVFRRQSPLRFALDYNLALRGTVNGKQKLKKRAFSRTRRARKTNNLALFNTCVHAEQNAICQAAYYGIRLAGSTIYVTLTPCLTCAKMIINAGIKRVVYKEGYPDEFSLRLFEEAGVIVEKFED